MGRLSGAITGGQNQISGGGRLSGVVTGEPGRKAKSEYYLQVEKQARYQKAVADAQKAAAEADKAQKNLQFWEGIAGAPKSIYQAAKETGAAVLDVGTRLSPLEGIRNVASGVSEVVKRQPGVPATTAFEKGVLESRGRKTTFEKVSGKKLTDESGNINWDSARQFVGRAMEAPTYAYTGAVKGAELVGKGLLSRILTRSAKALPEAGINTAIQTLEEGDMKNVPRNLLANALLMSGISNIGGEINLSKIGKTAKQTIDTLEGEIGPVSLTEKADVMEALQQGVKPSEIIENVKKIRSGEFTPDEVAAKVNEIAGIEPQAPKTPQVAKEAAGEVTEQIPAKKPAEVQIEAPKKTEQPQLPKKNIEELSGTTRESGYAKSLEVKAIEKKMADNFQDLAEYTPGVRKQQAQAVTELINSDMARVKRIIAGTEDVPTNIKGSSLALGVEQFANKNKDVELLRRLASSKISSQISEAGSTLSMLVGRNANEPANVMRKIVKLREENLLKRLKEKNVGKIKQTVKSEIREKIRKEIPKKETWDSFIADIEC